jgi:hypothetical protein
MNTRHTKRWGAVLTLVGAGLLALTGCGDDKYVATTQLTGANEVPAVTTTATGSATATLDGDELTVIGTFNGLSSDLHEVSGSPAHVHQGAVGTNGPIIFNLTITSTDRRNGSFTGSRDLSDEERQDFKNGLYYVNVHSATNQGGEIRGQLMPIQQDD